MMWIKVWSGAHGANDGNSGRESGDSGEHQWIPAEIPSQSLHYRTALASAGFGACRAGQVDQLVTAAAEHPQLKSSSRTGQVLHQGAAYMHSHTPTPEPKTGGPALCESSDRHW
jgi:hypothetical protein